MNSIVFHNPIAYAIFNKVYYWHHRCGQGFYKFLQPCNHKHYRNGDSWCEELDMSEKTFRKYLKEVCTPHINRCSFQNAIDPFNGKPFACFHDRASHKTFYFGNEQLIQKYQKDLDTKEGRATKKFAPTFRVVSESLHINNNNNNNPPKSPLQTSQDREEGRIKFQNKKDPPQELPKTAIEMHRIWLEKTKGKIRTPRLTAHFAQKLLEALKKYFKNSLFKWKAYCETVSSSDFLMGKVSTFKAWLIWVIKEKIINKILGGEYGVEVSADLFKETKSESLRKVVKAIHEKSEESSDLRRKLKALAREVTPQSFLSWFASPHFYLAEDCTTATVKGRFWYDTINDRYSRILESLGIKLSLDLTEFDVCPE